MSFISTRTSSRFVGREVLSEDQLRQIAPSIFAEDKHESRSERYVYVPTAEIVTAMRKEGFEPFSARQGNSRIEGKEAFTKHMVRFRHASEQNVARRIGGTYPEVIVINSHDGTSSYQVMAGLFRMVCLNGLVVADRKLASVKVPHKGDIAGQIIEGSYTVLSESRDAIEQAETWAGITLAEPEQLALANAVRVARFADADGEVRSPIEAPALLAPRRTEDRPSDLWTVTNRLQENTIRGGLSAWGRDDNGRRRRVTSRPVTGIDGDVRLNRAVWTLAEEMARLKTA